MAAKLKVDELESVDGSTNLILNNSVTMAATKTLPAASLTGNLPAISGANLTAIPAGNLTGTVADARISTLTASKLTGALPAISGANLTGVTSVGGATGADFNDNTKLRFGTGNDLEIYHDGSNSFIDDSGNGVLQIRSNDIYLQKYTGETMIRGVADGAAELYHNAVKKLETTATGVTVTGAIAGASNLGKVLQVVQSTSTTYTHPGTSYADVSSSSISITPSATSSKILYIYNTGGFVGGNISNCYMKLLRGSIIVREHNRWGYINMTTYAPFPIHLMYLDSPNTTSAVTYKLQAKEQNAGGWEINDSAVTNGAVVIAMEIEG